jgi:hypothetical protein
MTNNVGAQKGTMMDSTFWAAKSKLRSYARKWVKPKYTVNNEHIGSIGKNLGSVWRMANSEYKVDWKTYCTRYNQEHQGDDEFNAGFSPYTVFVTAMFAWYKTDPTHIDLTAVTVADIVTKDADVRTVMRAIVAGYTGSIAVYDDLISDIQ